MWPHLVLHDIRRGEATPDGNDFGISAWQWTTPVQVSQGFCLVDGEEEDIVQVVLCQQAGVTINGNLSAE